MESQPEITWPRLAAFVVSREFLQERGFEVERVQAVAHIVRVLAHECGHARPGDFRFGFHCFDSYAVDGCCGCVEIAGKCRASATALPVFATHFHQALRRS